MHILEGEITGGLGLAARNLAHVAAHIVGRCGLAAMVPGTLNVRLRGPYTVTPDAVVTLDEYDGNEYLKLQRCVVGGIRAVIVRPHQHETLPGWGHGPSHLELVSAVRLRDALDLADGATVRVEVGGDEAWWAAAGRGGIGARVYARRGLRWAAAVARTPVRLPAGLGPGAVRGARLPAWPGPPGR